MSNNFRSFDRETMFLMPPSVQDWLPKKHLARFVVEMVERLDLRLLHESYAGRGVAAYHPEMLIALLFCGYAVRFIAANAHPDHDTARQHRHHDQSRV